LLAFDRRRMQLLVGFLLRFDLTQFLFYIRELQPGLFAFDSRDNLLLACLQLCCFNVVARLQHGGLIFFFCQPGLWMYAEQPLVEPSHAVSVQPRGLSSRTSDVPPTDVTNSDVPG